MSRSKKKVPITKDPSNSKNKKTSSRINRRVTKHKLSKTKNEGVDEDLLALKNEETFNSRNVIDFKEKNFKGDKTEIKRK